MERPLGLEFGYFFSFSFHPMMQATNLPFCLPPLLNTKHLEVLDSANQIPETTIIARYYTSSFMNQSSNVSLAHILLEFDPVLCVRARARETPCFCRLRLPCTTVTPATRTRDGTANACSRSALADSMTALVRSPSYSYVCLLCVCKSATDPGFSPQNTVRPGRGLPARVKSYDGAPAI